MILCDTVNVGNKENLMKSRQVGIDLNRFTAMGTVRQKKVVVPPVSSAHLNVYRATRQLERETQQSSYWASRRMY